MRHPFFRLCLIVCFLLLAFPVSAVQDYWARSLPIPTAPQRIISLTPASTEMFYALGAQDKLVGVTHDCNYPPEAQKKTRVGRFGHIQIEKILKLNPDLIVATADMKKVLQPLRQLNIPVLALETPDLRSIRDNVLLLGTLTGQQAKAQGLNRDFLARIQALKMPTQRPDVFYLVWNQPLMTATEQSFIGEVLRVSGGNNIASGQKAPFVHYSLETLLKKNPDIVVLPKSLAAKMQWDRAPLNRLKAVQKKHILAIEDDLISRPGPRVLQALEQLNRYYQQVL